MNTEVKMDSIYAPSEDVVVREIEGEVIIVPLVAGVGNMEDEIFTLNETGKAILAKLDGKSRLKDVLESLSEEFESPAGEIDRDVIGFVGELFKRNILVEASEG